MWSYLKSDFAELLNVVKEDSQVILEKLHSNDDDNDDDDEKNKVVKPKATATATTTTSTAALQEAERRLYLEETYRTPLLYDDMDPNERGRVNTYLADFHIDEQTDEISAILNRHAVVQEYFATLVPHEISYQDFWSRYYYRCDHRRIQAAWEEQELAAQQARVELVGSVSSFFGGAAKSLASTVKVVVAQKDGRPPFVMNTAVDEDDDDEEEEEEELGWDDEDEEDDDKQQPGPTAASVNKDVAAAAAARGGENDDSVDTEQIEFHDEALDKTKEELKLAVLERDQLQQTVELLKKELAANSQLTAPAAAAVDVATIVKEKDTEIASLKASLVQMVESAAEAAVSTACEATTTTANNQVQELTQALVAKDREYEATTRALQDEIISLRAQLATSEAAAATKQQQMEEDRQRQLDQSFATITSLTTELAHVQAQWELAQGQVQQLRAEMEVQQQQQRNQDENDNNCQDSGDKTSEDSGVPVEAPRIVVTTTAVGTATTAKSTSLAQRGGNDDDDNVDNDDGETSDGWGDEW